MYNLYHTILLYYYAETKGMIYRLVNLKGLGTTDCIVWMVPSLNLELAMMMEK